MIFNIILPIAMLMIIGMEKGKICHHLLLNNFLNFII